MKPSFRLAALSLTAASLLACSSEGTGNVSVATWGEEYIEETIPASVFADGWTVKYSKFLVTFSEVKVLDGTSAVAALPRPIVVNHVTPGVKALASFPGLETGRYGVEYAIGPVADALLLPGVDAADFATMKANGWSLWIAGTASKGGVTKTFSWGFSTDTKLVDCEGELNGKTELGTVVTSGGTDAIELTIHGDHLFYDDLQDPAAKTRFQHLADADVGVNGAAGDGVITQEELAAVKLVDIPTEKGKFGIGGASSVKDLGAFVAFLSRTIGHFRGEGECHVQIQK
jgi:hypothetical protein